MKRTIYDTNTGTITYSHDAGNLSCGQNDIVTTANDVTVWAKFTNNWHLVSWKDASANLADSAVGGGF